MENEKKKVKKLTLPDELLFEILLKLPVRSLLRFKCVCTSWFFLISDPQFAKSHFDLNVAPTHRLLLQFPNKYKVESFDLDSSLDDSSAVVTLNFPPPSKSLCLNPLHFLGSCRGFMLLVYEVTDNVIVWNPSTGFRQQILYNCNFMSNSLYGFGYDKITDDYILVLIALFFGESLEKKIQTFSLKTHSWYDSKDVNVEYMDVGRASRQGVLLNDSLHWLVWSFITELHLVIAFDLVEKSLSQIPISPNLEAELQWKEYHLRVLGGYLSLCYSGEDGLCDRAEIWVMKEYKVHSSWAKTFVIPFSHIPCMQFFPICFIEGGGVVGSSGSGRLMKLNAKGKLLEHRRYGQKYKNVLKYFEMYRESLLLFPGEQPVFGVKSLPCDINQATEDEEEEGTEDEEEEATEDEEATDDEEETEDEEEDSEEETTEDDL